MPRLNPKKQIAHAMRQLSQSARLQKSATEGLKNALRAMEKQRSDVRSTHETSDGDLASCGRSDG